MIQGLRILEAAAGLALLCMPDEAKKYLEPLGLRVPTARELTGLRSLLH